MVGLTFWASGQRAPFEVALLGKFNGEKTLMEKIRIKKWPLAVFGWSKEKVFLKIIQCGVYLALFAPLVFWDSVSPYIVPRTIFFRVLVEIIFAAYIFLFFSNLRYRPKFSVLTIAVSLFFGILILTSFFGVNFERSFWSDFVRMTGLFTLLHLFAFYIVLVSVFRERKDWERIFTCLILAGIGFVLIILASKRFSIREGGTIGNSSFMAAYLLFNVFFSAILFLVKKGWWRIFYGTALLIFIPVLLASTTRGVIIAFYIGLFLLALGYLFFFYKKILQRFVLIIILFLVIFGGILLVPKLNSIKDKLIAVFEFPTLKARLVVWQMGWQGWKERFWLGWGPENYQIPFAKYFDPRLTLAQYGGEPIFDRVHNIILDTGVSAGLLGFLSYLAIFAVVILGLLRICQKASTREKIIVSWGMVVLLAVYFFQNLLLFDTISSYMMFFLVLAFVGCILEEERLKEDKKKEAISPVRNKLLEAVAMSMAMISNGIKKPISLLLGLFGAVAIIAVIFAFYFGNFQLVRSSFYVSRATISPLEQAIPIYQKAIKIYPAGREEISSLFIVRFSQLLSAPGQDKKALEGEFRAVGEEIKNCVEKKPPSFNFLLSLGGLYNDFGESDKEKLELAENVLQKAIDLSPRNQQGYWELAQTRILQKRYEEAFNLLQQAISLEPRLAMFHWYLAIAYEKAGQNELAKKKIEEIKKADLAWSRGLEEKREVIKIFWGLKDYSTMAFLLERVPEKLVWRYLLLGAAYYRMGEKEKSIEIIKKMIELDPSLTRTEEVIRKITENNPSAAALLEKFLRGLKEGQSVEEVFKNKEKDELFETLPLFSPSPNVPLKSISW